jgi:uncharacterized membrane protein YdbT with pleckstrin-like domain
MLRTLAPYLTLAVLIVAAAAIAYALGAPAWVAYAAIILAVVAVLPGYNRWDQHHHP